MFAADRAEALGDALGALEIMEAHLAHLPDGEEFWRPWRASMLMQLVMLRPVLPRWATSRWILEQALQHLEPVPDGRSRARRSGALEVAIELRGGAERLPGVDEVDAQCRVMDHDWVYRQVFLYDLGGLEHFLDRAATADLVVGADRIREWAATPMGGYRLVERRPATTTWLDLASGEAVETANIGSAALVVPGECVIGRLVPIEGGAMFEGAPLRVPEVAAADVAADPTTWVEALRSVPGGTAGDEVGCAGDIHGLVTDVPSVVWMGCLLDAGGVAPTQDPPAGLELAAGLFTLAEAALDLARIPPAGEVEPWSAVAAGLLHCSGVVAMGEAARPTDGPLLLRLADVLAEPAAGWCRQVAAELAQAA